MLSAINGRGVRQFQVSSSAHALFLAEGEDLMIPVEGQMRRERADDDLLRWSIPRPRLGDPSGPMEALSGHGYLPGAR